MSMIWKRAIVGADETLRDAVRTIDAATIRAAFVVDADGAFAGLITDGDVRRALLSGASLDDPCRRVMNATPRQVSADDEGIARAHAILRTGAVLHVPVVADGRLVDVVMSPVIDRPKVDHLPVFLMAGGFGKRLRPLTDDCPKPMLPVGGRPILETILQRFVDAGFREFYISTHYLPEVIHAHFGDGSAWGVDIVYVHEEEPLGTAGALALLPDAVGDRPVVVMNGDVFTDVDLTGLVTFHEDRGAGATICLREYSHSIPFGVVDLEEGLVTAIREKPVLRHYVNAGIYVLSAQVRAMVQAGERVDMPELLQEAVARGSRVVGFPLWERWLDLGRPLDLQNAHTHLAPEGSDG